LFCFLAGKDFSMSRNSRLAGLSSLILVGLSACGGGDNTNAPAPSATSKATLKVVLEPEGHVLTGLFPGTGPDDIRDGWTVNFRKVVTTVGNVQVAHPTNGSPIAVAHDVFVVDVAHSSASPGLPLWTLDNLPVGAFDFVFQAHSALDGARHNSAQQADFAEMQTNDWTYLIEGTLTQQNVGRSCPPANLSTPPATATPMGMNAGGDRCYPNPTINFRIGANAESKLTACGVSPPARSFMLAAGATGEASITIHADHLFMNGFAGQPGLIAQWLADSDLNLDGNVTNAELRRIPTTELGALDGVGLTAPFSTPPIVNMADYVGAVMKTAPQYNGDSKCSVGAT
jgi:hypothetical protein